MSHFLLFSLLSFPAQKLFFPATISNLLATQGETFTQSWPVTPFQVKITKKRTFDEKRYWVDVHVDGKLAAEHSIKNGESRTIVGYQSRPGHSNSEVRAFCFTRPRLLARGESREVTLTEQQRIDLSSIRIMVYSATYDDVKKKNRHTGITRGEKVIGVNKLAAKKGVVGSAACSGKVIRHSVHKTKRTYHVDRTSLICAIRVRYAPLDTLKSMAVYTQEPVQASVSPPSSSLSDPPFEPAKKKPKLEKISRHSTGAKKEAPIDLT